MKRTFKRQVLRFAISLLASALAGITLRAAPVPQEAAGQSEQAVGSSAQQQLVSILAAHPDVFSELVKQPRLITDKRYLRQHPELVAFLKEHAELVRRRDYWEKQSKLPPRAAVGSVALCRARARDAAAKKRDSPRRALAGSDGGVSISAADGASVSG